MSDHLIKCIINYSEKEDYLNLKNINDDYFDIELIPLLEINDNKLITEINGYNLFDILEKIYNEVYINELYTYFPYLKVNLYIYEDDFYEDELRPDYLNIKDDILKFKQKYDKISMKNYGHDALYYILQSLNILKIEKHSFFDLDELEYILCKDCKVKFIGIESYTNITLLQNFLINNETLKYLHVCIKDPNDITLLCDSLTKNDYLIALDLKFSKNLSYNDFIQIINSSKSIISYNFNDIQLLDSLGLTYLLITLEKNTIINSFNMINIYYKNKKSRKYYFDNIIINLLKNNKTLNTLNIFDKKFKKYFRSIEKSIMEGLKYNNTLIDLGKLEKII